jgi:CRP-like cAMP-binding protein
MLRGMILEPTASMLHAATHNRLLAALPGQVNAHFVADCSLVNLQLGEILFDVGDRVSYIYFPVTGFISMLAIVNQSILEVAMIGNEGMCGYPTILGGDVSGMRALVQGAGGAWRMKTATFRAHLKKTPALRELLQRYMNVVVNQLAQAAACTRFHIVEERLARWLLMTRDRAHADSFYVTQEFLGFMLGIRRVGITKAARSLQGLHLIRYKRGSVTIVNAAKLKKAACDCYRLDLKIYAAGMSSSS